MIWTVLSRLSAPFPAQQGHVVRRRAGADAALVLAEGNVRNPVPRVLDPPVTTYGPRQTRILGRQTGDEVAVLEAAFRLDPDQAAEAGPGSVGIDMAPVVRVDRGIFWMH